jgi:hypothetical protein
MSGRSGSADGFSVGVDLGAAGLQVHAPTLMV